MNRRDVLAAGAALSILPVGRRYLISTADAAGAQVHCPRPSEASWPSPQDWRQLNDAVEGRLITVRSPLAACVNQSNGPAACEALFRELKNPYYIGDEVALTQTSGWVDAWTSSPSIYAVAARRTSDVVAAVDFARKHNLRLVVKGGGHSYQGTSNASDSLLVWTRAMNDIVLHDTFVGQGCAGKVEPRPAVSIGAGAIWMHAYDAVTTKAGRYVQGGGCTTVGVAGLIQSGGFGSFSKAYGLAAASLLEAEIVTADGAVRIANACTSTDLFWAIKGGGGGSLGVITRLTLRTHDLPGVFGGANIAVKATSAVAYRRLIDRFLDFYAEHLFSPHWGEQVRFRPDNVLLVNMVFQGMAQEQARAVWQPFLNGIAASSGEFTLASPPLVLGVSARAFWNAPLLMKNVPGLMIRDDRPGAPEANAFWAGDQEQAGQVLHGYRSRWLGAALLAPDKRESLAEALFAGSQHWPVSLHFNKGLAGASAETIAAARDTATNPAVLDAFALAIISAGGPPAFPGIPGHEPNLALARQRAGAVSKAMSELSRLTPGGGSYLAESDFFEQDWQRSYWGTNYPRLAAVKEKYDPDGLFHVHHGLGSERWSTDGFTRLN